MSQEIELKYKINKLPKECKNASLIYQYYFDYKKHIKFLLQYFKNLNIKNISEARVRVLIANNKAENTKYFLTLKSKNDFIRDEYEKEIDFKTAKFLTKNNIIAKINKERYVVKKEDFTFEFDKFLNRKLFLVEIELKKKPTKQITQKIENILLKNFNLKYKNVTSNKNYKNINLAKAANNELIK